MIPKSKQSVLAVVFAALSIAPAVLAAPSDTPGAPASDAPVSASQTSKPGAMQATPVGAVEPATPPQKLKNCSTDASGKNLAGAERERFIKTCTQG